MAMRLPIDTSGMTLLAGSAPEPVVDFESKAPRADENGEPLFTVQLVTISAEGAEVIAVKVAGEPKGVTQGQPVRLTGLVAIPWSMDGRSGVSFKATRIEPATAAKPAA
jgi:hypothetical protein